MVATCDTAGILNTAVNFAASVEVTETLKFLVGARDKMRRTLLGRDLWTNDQAEINAGVPRARCSVCQLREFTHLRGEARPQITLCGRNSVQIHEHNRPIDFAEMQRRLEPHGKVNFNRLLLRFERGEYTVTVFADGRALVQGTTDVSLARSLYARFIGS
jgi:adenylyltransferase/sulfurtransferase